MDGWMLLGAITRATNAKKKEEMDLYRVPYSGLGWSSS